MKKTLMLVASVAMAVVLVGCGGSKKSSGEAEAKGASGDAGPARDPAVTFVNAILKGDGDAAYACCDTPEFKTLDGDVSNRTEDDMKGVERTLKELAEKNKGDEKYSCKAVKETIYGGNGYYVLDGKKCTERAEVVVELVAKDGSMRAGGNEKIEVKLINVDGKWKVSSYKLEDMGKGSRSTRSKYN